MSTLRIGFTDTLESIADFFITALKTKYHVVRDDANPDYLIFGDRNFGNNNVNFNDRNVVKIFYTGENQRFWDYKCHYAISFDHFDTEFHYRLPLHVLANFSQVQTGLPDARTVRRTIADYNPEKKFCSFVVKNPGCQMRNSMFRELSKYKQVDAGGPLFNNIGYVLPGGEQSVSSKLKFLNEYKFNICFENSSWPGYCTEKLFEALYAKTIPIYWGSCTAAMDFNRKAFLNWHDFLDMDLLIERIKRLDEDEDEYLEMFLQPMFPDNTVPLHWDSGRFIYWFDKYVYQGVING
jgi:alpha(1,3/1,4) fucosyltransferase